MSRYLTCLAPLLALTAACAPQETTGSGEEAPEAGDAATPAADASEAPDRMSETAWRTQAEDGARFVTYLDADGTYRDMRNGDPWQQGAWNYAEGPDGKEICFRPDHEDGVERCWLPGRTKDGTLVVTGPEGLRIELERAEYQAPEAVEEDASE